MLTGRIDLSSNELHITNECPFCHHEWMDKVKHKGTCPSCKHGYEMKQMEDGNVSIGWTLTADDARKLKIGVS